MRFRPFRSACFRLRTHSNVNLHVSTYNIHKGFSQFNRRMMIHELREHLQVLGADIIFLQEVQGLHSRHAARFEDWPDEPQYEFRSEERRVGKEWRDRWSH